MTAISTEAISARLDRTPDLLAMLRTSTAQDPYAPAVTFVTDPQDGGAARTLSYRTLLDYAEAIARRLVAFGLQPNEAVAVLSPSTPEALAVLIASAAVGVALPMNPLLSPTSMTAQLTLAKARVAFVCPEHPAIEHRKRFDSALPDCPAVELVIELPLLDGAAPDAWRQIKGVWPSPSHAEPRTPVSPGRAAALFHTGGTTGAPKLAELSSRGLVAGALISGAALQLRADDRLFQALPLFHVGGAITSTLAALSAGATVIFCGVAGARDPRVVQGVWRLLAATGSTVLVMVPTSLGAIQNVPILGEDLSRLRGVVTGSSALPPILAKALEGKLGIPVCQVFGMTELSGICTAQPLDGRSWGPAVGLPAPLVQLTIGAADETGLGEVMLGGPNLFLGYRSHEGLVDVPTGGRVASGDIGRIGEDGQLRLQGRRKDVIIRGGHNIDPLAIEDAALAFPGVLQAAAVAMPDAYAGEVPVLFVCPESPTGFDQADFERHLREAIFEPPARPRAVFLVEGLPLTPVGKVSRFELRCAAAERAVMAALADLQLEAAACVGPAAKEIRLTWRAPPALAQVATAEARLAELGLTLLHEADA